MQKKGTPLQSSSANKEKQNKEKKNIQRPRGHVKEERQTECLQKEGNKYPKAHKKGMDRVLTRRERERERERRENYKMNLSLAMLGHLKGGRGRVKQRQSRFQNPVGDGGCGEVTHFFSFFLINCRSSVVDSVVLPQLCNLHFPIF